MGKMDTSGGGWILAYYHQQPFASTAKICKTVVDFPPENLYFRTHKLITQSQLKQSLGTLSNMQEFRRKDDIQI